MAATFLKSDNTGKFILRIAIAVVIVFHGIAKIKNGITWMQTPLANWHLPVFFGYAVYLAEILAPVMLILGFRSRIAALLIICDMLFAIFMVLKQKIFTLNQGGAWAIELEALLLLGSLALFFTGGGKFGITGGRSKWD